ncbi:MAG: RNA polymerase sigma factor [Acidobacteriota bacterium]|nr:RNA polymerase sigma factor [Acidobacteriota bacterium]
MAVLEAPADSVVANHDWRHFYESLKPRATGLLQRYRIPGQDAEDILHDTLLLFLTKCPPVDDPSLWILATLKRRCGMYWREHRRRLHRSFEPAVLEALAEPVAPEQHKAALRYDLERALERLPEKRRRVLEAHYLDGRTPAETARLLGYRQSGIYKVLDRGVAGLAREMDTRGFRAESG